MGRSNLKLSILAVVRTSTMMRIVPITAIFYLSQCNARRDTQTTYPKIYQYQPRTDVRDHAVIDKDVALIEKLLAEENFKEASKVYEYGAYSRNYAQLQFPVRGLPGTVEPHTSVEGLTESGDKITGTLIDIGNKGDKTVRVLYQNADDLGTCFVGGNPEPKLDGCFAASGQLFFEGHEESPVTYDYNMLTHNKNDRTLQGFSTDASHKMKPCPHCDFYTDFSRFFKFYGKADFAQQWTLAALTGTRTVFDSSSADFTTVPQEVRSAAVSRALVVMHIIPFMIREMEEAAKECKTKCPKEGCYELGTRAVDAAAAYYFGSLENGNGAGKLMHQLADIECKEFKTCDVSGNSINGNAKANIEILYHLRMMQTNVTNRACPEARSHKDQITKWLKVTLIQGTLHYAYLRQQNTTSATDVANGAVYAASIAPFLSACSFTDAEIITNNMEVTARHTDFALVKNTLERQYTCLGIKCSDVGGYWDQSRNTYFAGAEMCSFDVVEEEEEEEVSKIKKSHWGIFGALLGTTVIAFYLYRRMRKTNKKTQSKFRETDIDFSDSSDDSDAGFRIS